MLAGTVLGMSTDSAETNTSPEPAAPVRPQTVDWAIFALIATCVLAIANGVARNFSESWVIANYRKNSTDKNKTDAELHKLFADSKTPIIVSIILIVAVLLVIGKFARDGKNWARWLLTLLLIIPIIPTAPTVFLITNATTDGPFAIRFFGGLTGFAAVTCISMLFVRPSAPYFRKPGANRRPSMLDGIFKPRGALAKQASGARNARPDASVQAPVGKAGPDLVKRAKGQAAKRATTPQQSPAPRKLPRAKSRKTAE